MKKMKMAASPSLQLESMLMTIIWLEKNNRDPGLDRLNRKRVLFWDQCIQEILNYQSASNSEAQALKHVHQAHAISQLNVMVKYEKEFPSVVLACIRKNAPEAIIDSISQ